MSGGASLRSPLALEAELAARSLSKRWAAQNAWLPALLALFATAVIALFEREHATVGAADRALSGIALGIALPLLAYALFDLGLGNQRLDRALQALARHGADRRLSAAFLIAALAACSSLAGLVLAAVAVLVTRAPGDPLLARDLLSSTWIGALAGLGYAGWFALGSTVGKRGGGRKWVLAFDFVLGASSGLLALPWPRAHVRNLLGGAAPLELGQGVAALCLLGMALITFAATLGRTPR